MESDPIRNDARRARRVPPGSACALCGRGNPPALVAVDRTLLEWHHAAGRAHAPDLLVPLCRNCHAVATEGQRDAGVDFAPPPTLLHQLAAALVSLAAFFADLGRTLACWADALRAAADRLDAAHPTWRALAPPVAIQ